ncbi:MAG: Bax inhibitor-1/YccA family protein [Coraliomargarita sp.]
MFQQEYSVRSMAEATPDKRAQFIRRTYAHLAGALLAFVGLEAVLINTPIVVETAARILALPYGWAGVIGALMLVGWMTRSMVHGASKGMQYLGLSIYVVMQALVFVPLVLMAILYAGSEILLQAGVITGLLFAGLTATVFITRKDFSFLSTALTIGGFIALGLIVCSFFVGGSMLGMWFSVGMIVLMAGSILYDTSNVLHHYEEDQYVGASLELFASFVLLLWYVLRLLISLRD